MQKDTIHSYKELVVWQKAKKLAVQVYAATKNFPKEEAYGLVSQMRRAVVSIPSNIAEGRCRGTRKDFVQFLKIAYGSGAELETQIEIAKELKMGGDIDYNVIDGLLSEIMKMLKVMIGKLSIKSLEANKLTS